MKSYRRDALQTVLFTAQQTHFKIIVVIECIFLVNWIEKLSSNEHTLKSKINVNKNATIIFGGGGGGFIQVGALKYRLMCGPVEFVKVQTSKQCTTLQL